MKKLLLGIGLSLTFLCSAQVEIEKINSTEEVLLKEFQNIGEISSLEMTKRRESGQKLTLCITFINKKDKTPVKDQTVLLYQTAKDGNYYPKIERDKSTARIKAIGITDDKGRLFVNTILPGSLAFFGDDRRIHIKVFGAEPETYELHFKQYTNARKKRYIESNDEFFLVDLKRIKRKKLIGFATIEVKNAKKPTNNE